MSSLTPEPLFVIRYSFCESVHASGSSPWHIRELVKDQKFGGGIDSVSLCGRVKDGWDLRVQIAPEYFARGCVCKDCAAEYKLRSQPC